MKKILAILLLAALALSFAACGPEKVPAPEAAPAAETAAPESGSTEPDTSAAEAETPETTPERPKVLVAYFSQTGNTRPLAERAAELLGADLYEITPEQPYTGPDINYNDPDSRSTREQNDPTARPAIAGGVENMEQYSVVVLAYPIWWGLAPRIVDTFLESYDFAGKTLVPFCTSASSGVGRSVEELKELCDGSALWAEGKRFPAQGLEELERWLREVPELSGLVS